MDNPELLKYVILPLLVYSAIVTGMLIRAILERKRKLRREGITVSQALTASEEGAQIHHQANEALRLSKTIQKFVPKQFMEHLEHGHASDLEVGHAVEDRVAILCADIRGFTGLSEELSPHELMRFLNSYFLRMNGPIHQNNGFIDKFIGDAIMALFDHPDGSESDKARDAIKAAIAMQKTVSIYNIHRKNCEYNPVTVGIGLHYGSVILGTVGSDDRMDTTVVGDNVNVAFRLESLTPKYKAGIVVSEELLTAAGYGFSCQSRILDFVRVRGRSRPIKIYEILDALPADEQTKKLSTKKDIELGIAHRMRKDWDTALSHFQAALKKHPEDNLIAHHIEMCYRGQKMSLPDNWDGSMSSPL